MENMVHDPKSKDLWEKEKGAGKGTMKRKKEHIHCRFILHFVRPCATHPHPLIMTGPARPAADAAPRAAPEGRHADLPERHAASDLMGAELQQIQHPYTHNARPRVPTSHIKMTVWYLVRRHWAEDAHWVSQECWHLRVSEVCTTVCWFLRCSFR